MTTDKAETQGILYLIPTPIGNLEDITLRALRLLKEVDRILAEDTRHSGKLLKAHAIATPMVSFHQHNTQSRIPQVLAWLQAGESVALISDAGTPGIRDPGEPLVAACVAEGLTVTALPGATAVTTALSASGLCTDTFLFDGFAPRKSEQMQRYLEQVKQQQRTVLLFESPKRLVKLLEAIVSVMGADRPVVVARELTKIHETYHRGGAGELLDAFSQQPPRGEIVVLIGPSGETELLEPEPLIMAGLKEGLPIKEIARLVADKTGRPRKELYTLALQLKSEVES
uniref:Ribosomal RNA small subunit methyltransferase I n=1 Tax=Magnetococcus massalia (strain MO-1) TaxID=451514 RepID=A0A1S7LME0_MAGMO|nr:methyltransferase [Candidatus Magnetococcus massalia]